MAELINIILRLALYVDLLLLFGVALFALYNVNAPLRFRPLLRGLALLGALLSVAGLLLMTSAMSGETELAALWPHLQMMLLETDVGLAWALRMIALIVVLVQPGKWLASMAGAVALSSLAWSGHGAMDEGWLRLWHFLSDILYGMLLAIKVLLFAAMLVLAALNRFHLGPALERSIRNGQHVIAANALRRSVLLELGLALLIVALVAWLGTLSPDAG
jgi:putative copper resistance protein D